MKIVWSCEPCGRLSFIEMLRHTRARWQLHRALRKSAAADPGKLTRWVENWDE